MKFWTTWVKGQAQCNSEKKLIGYVYSNVITPEKYIMQYSIKAKM